MQHPFPLRWKARIAEDKEKSRWLSSRTLTHKRPAVFQKKKQIQRPVKRAKGKASVKTGQQEICLCPAFQIPDAAQAEAQQGNDEL